MAHFAQIDENNIVQRVIVVSNDVTFDENNQEVEQKGIDFCKSLYGENTAWVQTSYNHNFRKQFAGIGALYDSLNDVFIVTKPYDSWTLDSNFDWQPPVEYPNDGQNYQWNEDDQTWDLIS